MGNFYGGSTVIQGGRFSSYDPADNSAEHTRNKKSKRTEKPATPPTQQKSRRIKRSPDINEIARKNFLNLIIDQMLAGRVHIKIPRNLSKQLADAITTAKGPIAWAENQVEYEALTAQKLKKLKRKERRKSAEAMGFSERTSTKKEPPAVVLKPIKHELTEDDVYEAKRFNLMRSLVDQMIARSSNITIPTLDSRLLNEIKEAGSPLQWLQNQPDYRTFFKARYLATQSKSVPPAREKSKPLKKKAKKQKKPKAGVLAESKAKGSQPKKKRVKHYYDPYEKPSRPVTPLSDAPVSYILKQLDKAADEPFNPRKIDWDVT